MFALALERFAIPGQWQSGYELWLQLSEMPCSMAVLAKAKIRVLNA